MKTIIFKPTYRCNLKCSYCYEAPHRDSANPPMMTQEQSIEALGALFKIYPGEQ